MTTTGSVTSSTTPTVTGKDGTTTFSTATDRTAMDTNTFLKLLVAQLQYQDPSKPTDSSAFLAQTAQFTSVEKMTQLTDQTQKVLDATLGQTGTSLVGKTVTYTDVAGNSHTGQVTGCTVGAAMPNLTIDGVQVQLSSVTAVTTTATPASGSSTSGSSTSGSSGSSTSGSSGSSTSGSSTSGSSTSGSSGSSTGSSGSTSTGT